MPKNKMGKKQVCVECGCKFYDLEKTPPVCPKCGVEQTEQPKKGPTPSVRQAPSSASIYSASPRTRHKKMNDEWDMDESSVDGDRDDDEKVSETIEDGLSVIDGNDMADDDDDDG